MQKFKISKVLIAVCLSMISVWIPGVQPTLAANEITVSYEIRVEDAGSLDKTSETIQAGSRLTSVPNVVLSKDEVDDGWKLDGYYINDVKHTGLELVMKTFNSNTHVEVRLIKDSIGQGVGNDTTKPDGIDDRNQAVANFKNWDNTILKGQVILKGKDATPPAINTIPERPGFTFKGWSTGYTNIQGNTDIIATYNQDVYSIIFVVRSGDEGVLSANEVKVNNGDKLESNVPTLKLSPEEVALGWKFDGYYINNQKVTGVSLANMDINYNFTVEVRTIIDKIGQGDDLTTNIPDGIDDRTQAVVRFINRDGALIKAEVVERGQNATLPIAEFEGYVFKEWKGNYENIQKNETVTAIYKNNHKITFVIESDFMGDKGVLSETEIKVVEDEKLPSLPTIIFTEEELRAGWKYMSMDRWTLSEAPPYSGYWAPISDDYFEKNTIRWDMSIRIRTMPDMYRVGTGPDIYYSDGIDDREQSLVRFIDYDGVILKTQVIPLGLDIVAPGAPERQGYIFLGWNKPLGNIQSPDVPSKTSIQPYDVNAIYNRIVRKITFTFRGGDAGILSLGALNPETGDKIWVAEVNHGEKINTNIIPRVILDSSEVVAGWKFDGYYLDNVKYTGLELLNLTITRDMQIEVRTTKDGIGQGEGNATNKPDGIDDRTQAIVTFRDYDNSIIKAQVILKGGDAIAPTAPNHPEKPFKGWDKSFTGVQGNLDVYAVYNAVHTITYFVKPGDSGAVLFTEAKIEEGKKIGSNVSPVEFSQKDREEGWVLVGYYIDGKKYSGLELAQLEVQENIAIEIRTIPDMIGQGTGNMSNIPDGIDDRNQAIVTFKNWDNTVLKVQVVMKGGNAKAPEAPEREAYKFVGWDKSFAKVSGNLTVTAVFVIKPIEEKPESKPGEGDKPNSTMKPEKPEEPVKSACGVNAYWNEKDNKCHCAAGYGNYVKGKGCTTKTDVPDMGVRK